MAEEKARLLGFGAGGIASRPSHAAGVQPTQAASPLKQQHKSGACNSHTGSCPEEQAFESQSWLSLAYFNWVRTGAPSAQHERRPSHCTPATDRSDYRQQPATYLSLLEATRVLCHAPYSMSLYWSDKCSVPILCPTVLGPHPVGQQKNA